MQTSRRTDSPRRPFRSSPRIDNFEHIDSILDELFDDFERGVEETINERGGFVGPVRPTQRRLSRTLDELAHGRDLDSLSTEAQE